MNVSVLLLVSLPLFWVAYKFYGKYISNVFGEDPNRPTPAVALKDDVDFVPTKPGVLFGHHFAAIAGGGPILGPTMAAVFGYMPVLLWLVLGTIFIGGVHDLCALYVSVREKGKSIAEVARTSLGKLGFFLFITFTIIMLLLVTSAFLDMTALSLTSIRPLADLGLPENQTVLKTTILNGVKMGRIGGIASTSVLVITACAPFIGWAVYRKNLNIWLASLLAMSVCVGSVFIGLAFPVALQPETWKIVLTIYTIFAAGIPVWLVLQPRDFVNSYILYLGIALLLVGLFIGGLHGVKLQAPAFNIAEGQQLLKGSIWPILFITVACGAISGFHALVSGGTSCKQIRSEKDARPIAFGAMIIEAILAVTVVLTVSAGLKFVDYKAILYPTDPHILSNPILAFSSSMGGMLDKTIGIPAVYGTIFGILLVEGFVITTMDTAVRLTRYMIEELWSFIFKVVPKVLKSYIVNAGIAVAAMYLLAKYNTYKIIWPLFGTANQLLAALTLIAVSVWLLKRKKPTWFTLIPAGFMIVTTIASLVILLKDNYLPKHNYTLATADILLMLLAAGVLIMSAGVFFGKQTTAEEAAALNAMPADAK